MAKRLTDTEVEAGISKLAKDRDWSVAAATRFLCGVGLVRLRALTDYAAKQEQKAAVKAAKVSAAVKTAVKKEKPKAAPKKPKTVKKAAPETDKADLPRGIGTSPSFSAMVNKAAATMVKTHAKGAFGDHQVFISALWKAGFKKRYPLPEFKQKLVAAQRAGEVKLLPADLVGVMDPKMVAESETVNLEARYHFVEV